MLGPAAQHAPGNAARPGSTPLFFFLSEGRARAQQAAPKPEPKPKVSDSPHMERMRKRRESQN